MPCGRGTSLLAAVVVKYVGRFLTRRVITCPGEFDDSHAVGLGCGADPDLDGLLGSGHGGGGGGDRGGPGGSGSTVGSAVRCPLDRSRWLRAKVVR